MNSLWKICVLACVVGAAAWWAAAGGSGTTVRKSAVDGRLIDTPAPRQELLTPDETYHGLAWQIHHSEGCVQEAEAMLGQIADLGADTVLITNAGYQKHAGSDSFKIDPAVTPSKQQWQKIFDIAHRNGLRVVLMPMILLSEPRGTEWRGVINPPSWNDWVEQYRKFLLYFARIAADGNVEVMMIGSELVSAEKSVHIDQWRSLIRDVRRVYPGKLSYSSNWDHYKVVEFWSELDLVGMTSYYKLSNEPNPTLESLIEAWKPIKTGLLRWQKQIGKPLLFTEVGWCSQEGASIDPWNYYHSSTVGAGGLEEQRRCYRAFIETWRPETMKNPPAVGGAIWWEWMNTPGGPDDFNYTPRGKPAEQELRQWFAQVRQHRTVAQSPAANSEKPKPAKQPSAEASDTEGL